jgi:hypothetical protein
MAITASGKHLVRGLQFFPLTEQEREAIYVVLDTDEQKMMFMEYMANHEHATAQELKNEVGRILKMTQKKYCS